MLVELYPDRASVPRELWLRLLADAQEHIEVLVFSGTFYSQTRLHSTTLYSSLFRYDDEILVNPHAYGEPASANLTLHLRHIDGGQVAAHYMKSFERVWETALPWPGQEI